MLQSFHKSLVYVWFCYITNCTRPTVFVSQYVKSRSCICLSDVVMTYVFVTGGCWPCRPSTNCRIWQANRSTSSLTTSVVSAQVCSSSLHWSVTQCTVLSHVNSWSFFPTPLPCHTCSLSASGAILAFMLGIFQIPLEECEEMYRKLGADVFKQNVIVGTVKMGWSHAFYDSEIWENILK